jgi:cytochrome P450
MSEHLFQSFRGVQDALRNTDLEQSMYTAGAIIMDDVLLTLHGPEHHRRRTASFKVFGRGYFRYYERDVFPATLSRTLEPFLAQGGADLIDCGYRVTLNLTADFAGIDRPEQSPAETAALLHCVKRFSEAATLFHSKRDHAEVIAAAGAALEEFDARFLAPSKARRETALARFAAGEIPEDELPRDVLTVLLRSYAELELSPEILRREIAFYMQAGAHSTANSTVHAMHHILDWCEAHPGSRAQLLEDRLLLQRFVHESLRLHPASPVARRRAGCPTQIGTQTAVDAGDDVIADIHAANRESAVFGPDAGEFNPYRSVPAGVWPFGLTFGFGMHACMGRDLDGGVVPRADTRADDHQYGIVMLFVESLLRHGARRDPANPPLPDTSTQRPNWGRYPVLLDPR